MRPLGPAAAVLDRLAQVEPLHFASFYARTRLYRGGTKAAPAEVILDLTQDCPLDCAFCLAGETRGGGQRMELPQLQALAQALSGVPRLLLVGGEPLAHPHIREVLALLRDHAGEVEVITGGATLPTEQARFAAWIGDRIGAGHAPLGLTLSVDAWHRDAVGPAAFAARVQRMLELQAQPPVGVHVRFLVTDPRLKTAGYLRREVILAVLSDLHPRLAERWQTLFAARRADDVFRLGPVVRLGDASTLAAEPLDAGDLAFAGEVVLTPRGQDGTFQLLRALPATWMRAIPAGLQRGGADPGQLAEVLERTVVAEALGLGHDQEATALWRDPELPNDPSKLATLRQHSARHWQQSWPQRRAAWLAERAAHLDAVCAPDLPWVFGVDRPHRRVHVPLLRELWRLRAQRSAAFGDQLVRETVRAALEPLQAGGWPAFVGYRAQPGLITDRPDAPVPLHRVPLDLGVATPYLGDAWVRPRLVLRAGLEPPDGHPVLCLDGLGAAQWQSGDLAEATRAFCDLLRVVLQALPTPLHQQVRSHFTAELSTLASNWQRAGETDLAEAARSAALQSVEVAAEPLESPADVLRLVAGPRVEGWGPDVGA